MDSNGLLYLLLSVLLFMLASLAAIKYYRVNKRYLRRISDQTILNVGLIGLGTAFLGIVGPIFILGKIVIGTGGLLSLLYIVSQQNVIVVRDLVIDAGMWVGSLLPLVVPGVYCVF